MTFRDLTDNEKLEIAEIIASDTLNTVNLKVKKPVLRETVYSKYIKRTIDIIVSGFALLAFLPINFILLIGTIMDVGLPVLFYQTRIGKDLRLFKLGKFRNMTNQRDANGILLPANERVTKFGSFVRRTSLDELLNFWYIFIGKMSIIGPRPMPDEYLHRFNNRHIQRHLVRPGLECPLHSKEYMGQMTWMNRFENDIWYVENISFKTDIRLFTLLIKDALFDQRKEHRSKADVGTFIGYFDDGQIMDSDSIPPKYFEIFNNRRTNE